MAACAGPATTCAWPPTDRRSTQVSAAGPALQSGASTSVRVQPKSQPQSPRRWRCRCRRRARHRTSARLPGGTSNVGAFDAFLRGRALYELSTDEASERGALALFDQAIALDPAYAAAHAARSRSLTTLANQYAKVGEHAAMYDQAVTAAQRAVAWRRRVRRCLLPPAFVRYRGALDARAERASRSEIGAAGCRRSHRAGALGTVLRAHRPRARGR